MNILNNSSDSRSSHDNKSTRRSFDNNNLEIFRNNYINSFMPKEYKNSIDIIPFRERKNSFSILNTQISLELNDDNSKILSKRIFNNNHPRRKTNIEANSNNKFNLYSIKSFNAAKMSWSKKKKNFNKSKTTCSIINIKKVSETQNKLNRSPKKSIFYKNKKLNLHKEKFEDFKHFSPLVKNVNKLKDRKTFFNNNLRISQKISPLKINKKNENYKKIVDKNDNNDKKDKNRKDSNRKIFKNIPINVDKRKEIKKENNSNQLEQLPLININNKNKNDIKKNDIINNNNESSNIFHSNTFAKIEKDNTIKEMENVIKKDEKYNLNKTKIKRSPNSFQEINQYNKNDIDIPKITLNNLRLSKTIQENLEEYIDNSHCVYCLKRVIKPITLSCEHELCLSCAEEIISLYNFIHIPNIEINFIKCPKCKKKTDLLNNDLNNMLRLNWRPMKDTEQLGQNNPLSAKKIYEKKIQL
jgi:hypothetical protein